MCLAIGAVVAHGNESFGRLVQIHARRVGSEVWLSIARDCGDGCCLSAGCRHPHDLNTRSLRARTIEFIAITALFARAARNHNALAVSGVRKFVVEAGMRADTFRLAIALRIDLHAIDVAAILLIPGDERHIPPIWRPCR